MQQENKVNWHCPICETINCGEICSACGAARPTLKKATKKVLRVVFQIAAIAIIICSFLTGAFLWSKENSYRNACGLFDSGSYAAAREAFEELGDFKDSAELRLQSFCLLVEKLYTQGYYDEALDETELLKQEYPGYAEKLINAHSAELYDYAVSLYGQSKYQEVAGLFEQLNGYDRASDYLLLCNAHQNPTTENLEPLLAIAGFEDSSDMILSTNKDVAMAFLQGTWAANGRYIMFQISDDPEYDYLSSWSISDIDSGKYANPSRDMTMFYTQGIRQTYFWSFNNGIFSTEDYDGNNIEQAVFKIIDQDTITIEVLKTGAIGTYPRYKS